MVDQDHKECSNGKNIYYARLWLKGYPTRQIFPPYHWLTTFQEHLNNSTLQEALDMLPMVKARSYHKEVVSKLKMLHASNRKITKHPHKSL